MAEGGCLESPFAARAAPGREVVEAFGVGEKDSEEDLGLNDGRPGLLAADSCDCRRAGEYGRLPADAEATGPPWPAAPLSGHIFALPVRSRRRSASNRAPKRACLGAPVAVAIAIAITAGVFVFCVRLPRPACSSSSSAALELYLN